VPAEHSFRTAGVHEDGKWLRRDKKVNAYVLVNI